MPIKPSAMLLFFVFQGRDGLAGAEALCAGNVFRKPLYYIYVNPSESPSELCPRGRCRPEVLPFGTASIKHIISVPSDDDLNNFIIFYYTSPHSRRNFFDRSVVTYLYYNVVFKMILQRGQKVDISSVLLLLLCIRTIV